VPIISALSLVPESHIARVNALSLVPASPHTCVNALSPVPESNVARVIALSTPARVMNQPSFDLFGWGSIPHIALERIVRESSIALRDAPVACQVVLPPAQCEPARTSTAHSVRREGDYYYGEWVQLLQWGAVINYLRGAQLLAWGAVSCYHGVQYLLPCSL
jgi:hypothetical protein